MSDLFDHPRAQATALSRALSGLLPVVSVVGVVVGLLALLLLHPIAEPV